MHELLQGLGWTDAAINIVEILFYVILILSGLLAIIRQIIKGVHKLIPKLKDAKSLKHKLAATKAFLKWLATALKDGSITDEELNEINKILDDIATDFASEKRVQCSAEDIEDIPPVNKVGDSIGIK